MLGNSRKSIGFINNYYNSKGLVLDSSTKAFIAAYNITNPTQINALNRLVLNYKGIGNLNSSIDLWTDTDLILPIVGSNATAHRGNLKTATSAITFFGGLTHNANGITGNGTNGYGLLTISPNSLLQNNNRVSGYVRTDNGAAGFAGVIGSTDASFTNGLNIEIFKTGATLLTYNNTSFKTSSLANRTGLIGINRTISTNYKEFRNGILLRTITENSLVPISFLFTILANNNGGFPIRFSPENVAFYSLGKGLIDANVLLEYQIIQQFQTDLGRSV